MSYLNPLLTGFGTSVGLIVAIGAQNAFVIRQGLLGHHLFLTALLCSILDAALIALGVFGFGQIIVDYPVVITLTKYFAIIFLLFYAAVALRSVFINKSLDTLSTGQLTTSRKNTIIFLLAITLLNPHVYLDTVILLGSIAAQQPQGHSSLFALGAMSASFLWFFTITYASRMVSPWLSTPFAWKIIDLITAVMMGGIAISLMLNM